MRSSAFANGSSWGRTRPSGGVSLCRRAITPATWSMLAYSSPVSESASQKVTGWPSMMTGWSVELRAQARCLVYDTSGGADGALTPNQCRVSDPLPSSDAQRWSRRGAMNRMRLLSRSTWTTSLPYEVSYGSLVPATPVALSMRPNSSASSTSRSAAAAPVAGS